ncbi:Osmotically-inducible protein Y [Dickeya dianthicola]|uniref:Osmotically-inducible protein Y n=1 Tax=Dickeya dianthicola TaxID=204039 RepID=A0AAP6RWB5_9GAMM|nr:molecular chaperone OsmY [Dickeya dianthicola]AYC17413.1 Osmotically-inducible protein Y [Dickeya dianthicola]MBI0439295.1 molecular chaperone OsmY [Dickeya dianthicola]MBI0450461.1 molecular chaperone OsmY [Dickeya dianthicola]MBI0454502.1 molecular chaperone OsmY [Dickeya dianthicola]MBI0458883.1 molecular chaperone OsmY [Dickeya dianthicola]
MKKTQFAFSTKYIFSTKYAFLLATVLTSGQALAEQETLAQQAQRIADTAGKKIDSSVQQAADYVDDSTLTARVKSALLKDETLDGNDISVSTHGGVVTLSGFIASQQMATGAVKIAGQTEGVKSVSDKLQVKDNNGVQSVGMYADDTLITGTIKAKLLADDIVPSRHVKVETRDGVVLLTGQVTSRAQADRAEAIAKAVNGVKSVKNELTVKS